MFSSSNRPFARQCLCSEVLSGTTASIIRDMLLKFYCHVNTDSYAIEVFEYFIAWIGVMLSVSNM